VVEGGLFMSDIKNIFVCILFLGIIAGCNVPDSSKDPVLGKKEGGEVQSFGMIMGTVKDMNGQLLADVEIKTQGLTTKTNAQGYFVLSNLPETESLVVVFQKPGYVMTSDIAKIRIGESSFLEPVMKQEEHHQTFAASNGATVQIAQSGAAVKIPVNALVDSATGRTYNGEVSLAITPFDPTTEGGQAAFPGEFKGITLNGEKVPIESYGFMDVTPRTSDGKPLQLAPGQMAEIAIPIAPSLLERAPDRMPLWYFNPTDGQWHEEGVLVRDGVVYRAKISHFSIWNCDVAYDRSYVIGRVVDCSSGQPVKGARVTIRGQRGWTSGETSTPDDGRFRIPVDANHNCEIWPAKNGVTGDKKRFTSAATNGVYDVGDICLGTPKIKIALVWDIEPRDLDAHLTYPLGGSRKHVYFSNKRTDEAGLDTDDTSGFGPEIISVFKLKNGVYRYSVHHFSGGGTISSSKANVSMMIDGVGIYQMNVPTGAQGIGDLWVLWDIAVENGKVIKVEPIHSIKLQSTQVGEKDYNPLW
jgi:hypothetical protein